MTDLLRRFIAWVFALFEQSERSAGAAEERTRIDAENAARLKRQNEIVNKPVSNDELQKSLRDGSF